MIQSLTNNEEKQELDDGSDGRDEDREQEDEAEEQIINIKMKESLQTLPKLFSREKKSSREKIEKCSTNAEKKC